MSEWLDVMLGEIERKKQEAAEAADERQRRARAATGAEENENAQEK
ncbi:MAG: hypothetical protein U5K38_06170 [Woeseiaceae bacterium]|nr:hypothetical protein [Woeseiaceae bacterium]